MNGVSLSFFSFFFFIVSYTLPHCLSFSPCHTYSHVTHSTWRMIGCIAAEMVVTATTCLYFHARISIKAIAKAERDFPLNHSAETGKT